MKTLIIFILALITITLGCERMPSLPPDTQAPAPEITIGVHVPLTGTWGEVYGLPMKRGFELARKEINASSLLQGLHLSFITIDDQSNARRARIGGSRCTCDRRAWDFVAPC